MGCVVSEIYMEQIFQRGCVEPLASFNASVEQRLPNLEL